MPWIALGLLLIPVLVVYGALWKQARPLPMQDDFLAIVNFGIVYEAQPSVSTKLLYIVAAQHNEYKLVVEHAIVAADVSLTGHLHFGLYIWIGNLMLLPIGWLLWLNLRQEDSDWARRVWLFVPVCWLLFQMNYVENLDWAMCGLQTMPVVLFTLAALHFLIRPGRRTIVFACVFAALGCLSSANGFLMGPVGVVLLLTNRRIRQMLAWCAAYGVAGGLYLYRYRPFTPPHYQGGLRFGEKLLFFFSFAGAWAENMHHFPLRYGSVVVGCVVCVIAVVAARMGLAKREAFYSYALLWCLITAALAADKRVGEGLVVALSMRYKIYSDIALICLYAFAVAQFQTRQASQLVGRNPDLLVRNRRLAYGAVLFVVVCIASVSDVFGYKFLTARRRFSEEAMEAFAADPSRNSPDVSAVGTTIEGGSPDFSRKALLQAIQTGLYRMP